MVQVPAVPQRGWGGAAGDRAQQLPVALDDRLGGGLQLLQQPCAGRRAVLGGRVGGAGLGGEPGGDQFGDDGLGGRGVRGEAGRDGLLAAYPHQLRDMAGGLLLRRGGGRLPRWRCHPRAVLGQAAQGRS
ncbi:hypothetical protein Stube_53750 [Streptomyces tubercidicus]|uniref:Uncharacterized protein n=1 Tax=Streptomyces tubercidicus TaxID=47759 RepID=A0A640UZI3_9ACTN|nr:hypothetical protein Stube_53750 [Streptomyces tubercidicus]